MRLEGLLSRAEADIAERNTKIMLLHADINAKDSEITDLNGQVTKMHHLHPYSYPHSNRRPQRTGDVDAWGLCGFIISTLCITLIADLNGQVTSIHNLYIH